MSVKKSGLGKGLSALIKDKEKVDSLISEIKLLPTETVELVELNSIIPREDQPRKVFDKGALDDLAQSIKENGVIQPIILRKAENEYQIIAGERRWRAAKLAGLVSIPSIVRSIDAETTAKISLIENIQRENLNAIEEAQAYKSLLDEYDLKQEELAKAVGKSRAYISNTLRLLKLDKAVIEYIYEGKLSAGHGKALLSIEDKEEQKRIADRIIADGLNVRETENKTSKNKKRISKKMKDSYIIDLEEQLMGALGTKVQLVAKKKSGKIEIEYYDNDDLERLLDLLLN
ncbi:MAG: ParB/RepB/Spo0J family partition protein [Gudongella sp.]|nr:ParB/RepB/Spo0J family partition protein [Gudongella sp.]